MGTTSAHVGCVLQLRTILLLVRHQQQQSKVVSQPDHEHMQAGYHTLYVK
jgi:hypothetical protein